MAGQKQQDKIKKENALVRYVRGTIIELRKVRWPSRKEALALTRIVIIVTVGMAVFLGVLDLFFGQLLAGIIGGELLFYVLGVVLVAILAAAFYFIGRGEEV